ncbi:MAG: bifunctional diaminohydroxyphosphoribosylaminopyrimidine deaminase/5-amino-6-(5-phosphoribosylamino)uracil reductase RibD [Alphaproteobacteria bacterium]
MTFSSNDEYYMRTALVLARRGLGRTAPNPSVGCVLVKNDHLIAAARTGDGGRPHAEISALEKAGHETKGATAYVTLEPCSHMGQTPPCAEALIHAGVKRVVSACIDTNPRVSGQGLQMLKKAGIQVDAGLYEDEAKQLNAGFFLRILHSRPLVTLKIASTGDGVMVPPVGQGSLITGDLARRHVHLERSMHDAILVGIGTALADDPLLTTRLPGIDHKTVRIILDANLRLPPQSRLAQTACEHPLWIFYAQDTRSKGQQLEQLGAHLFKTNPRDLPAVLRTLADGGLTRVLVEGGGEILSAFLQNGLYDRFLWYKAPPRPVLKGGRMVPDDVLAYLNASKSAASRPLGQDLLEIYQKA